VQPPRYGGAPFGGGSGTFLRPVGNTAIARGYSHFLDEGPASPPPRPPLIGMGDDSGFEGDDFAVVPRCGPGSRKDMAGVSGNR